MKRTILFVISVMMTSGIFAVVFWPQSGTTDKVEVKTVSSDPAISPIHEDDCAFNLCELEIITTTTVPAPVTTTTTTPCPVTDIAPNGECPAGDSYAECDVNPNHDYCDDFDGHEEPPCEIVNVYNEEGEMVGQTCKNEPGECEPQKVYDEEGNVRGETCA